MKQDFQRGYKKKALAWKAKNEFITTSPICSSKSDLEDLLQTKLTIVLGRSEMFRNLFY